MVSKSEIPVVLTIAIKETLFKGDNPEDGLAVKVTVASGPPPNPLALNTTPPPPPVFLTRMLKESAVEFPLLSLTVKVQVKVVSAVTEGAV